MDIFDSELEQQPRRPTEEELNWLKENGGSGEGIILCLFPVTWTYYADFSKLAPDGSIESSLDYPAPDFRVGEKANINMNKSPEGYPLESLLVEADDDFKKNWPRFLQPLGSIYPPHVALLAGVHLNDFLKINFSKDLLGTRAVLAIDLLKTVPPEFDKTSKENFYLLGRKITVETILGGRRTLMVAEDWQERLREAMSFRFRKWDEVLDVIEEKGK